MSEENQITEAERIKQAKSELTVKLQLAAGKIGQVPSKEAAIIKGVLEGNDLTEITNIKVVVEDSIKVRKYDPLVEYLASVGGTL